jgi:hypothetical protein
MAKKLFKRLHVFWEWIIGMLVSSVLLILLALFFVLISPSSSQAEEVPVSLSCQIDETVDWVYLEQSTPDGGWTTVDGGFYCQFDVKYSSEQNPPDCFRAWSLNWEGQTSTEPSNEFCPECHAN